MKLVQTGWWQQGVSEGRLWRETPTTRKEGLTSHLWSLHHSLTEASPPGRSLPRLRLPLKRFRKCHCTSSLVPAAPGHNLTLPRTRGQRQNYSAESPLGGADARCFPTSPPAPTPRTRWPRRGTAPSRCRTRNSQGERKGPGSPPRRGIPAPCSAGHPPCRPGLHRGLAPGGTAEHEMRRALTGVERHGRAR